MARQTNEELDKQTLDEFQKAMDDLNKKLLNARTKVEREAIKSNADYKRNIERKNTADLAKYTRDLNKQAAKEEKETRKLIIEQGLDAYKEAAKQLGKSVQDAEKEFAEIGDQFKKDIKEGVKDTLKEGLISGDKGLISSAIKMSIPMLDSVYGKVALQVANTLSKVSDDVVESASSVFKSYSDKVDTRLLGVSKTFKQFTDSTNKFTNLYNNSEYITNIASLVEQGIVTNVEQRAFLMTIKDSLVTTFDVQNETLRRLIRIQHEDSTAARMGMEGYLNQYLNSTFQNTEYLSTMYDNVSASIEEAISLMSAQDAVSTEYTIQKWLGSLYSAGMSQTGVSAIAQALGQLGSGNINNLVGTNIGNLMAMASKGNYGNYLKDGLSEFTVNTLMTTLVDYLKEINSGNNVVKSQISSLFGLSISDLRAASSLNTSNIARSTLSYDGATGALTDLMGSASSRITQMEKFDNFFDNIAFALGSEIAGSASLYTPYRLGDIASGLLGEDNIVSQVAKGGALLGSLLATAMDVKKSDMAAASLLDTFINYGGIVTTGTGLTLDSSGTNSRAIISNRSSGDMKKLGMDSIQTQYKANTKEFVEGNEMASMDVRISDIRHYLFDIFDIKMDSLIGMTASMAGYTIKGSSGTELNNKFALYNYNGFSSVRVYADSASNQLSGDLTKGMWEGVSDIVSLLRSVISNGSINVNTGSTTHVPSSGDDHGGGGRSMTQQWGYKI